MKDKTLFKGPRGGTYWLDDEGKKHYVKGKQAIVKKEDKPKMKTYICYYNVLDKDGYYIDDFKEWCKETSKHDAEIEFRNRYAKQLAEGTMEIVQIV